MKSKLKDIFSVENSPIDQENWYPKSEPTLQIDILKKIALDGFQSKKSLIDILRKESSTIDTTVNKMAILHNLIQTITYHQKKPKHKPEILYSLTEKSIKILVKYYYQKNDNPYLSIEEFFKFLKNVYGNHNTAYNNEKNVFHSWIRPNITKKQVIKLYVESNIKYISSKNNSTKIKQAVTEHEKARKSSIDTWNKLASAIYEGLVYSLKR